MSLHAESHGWNFADVLEAVADRQPDALAQRHGGRSTTWARVRPPRRRRRRHAARRRRRRAGQGRPVPLQLARVPGVDVRRLQGRAGHRQHELPLHRRRARLPVGQRRRRRRRVPRHVRRARSTSCGRGCRAIRTWLWVDDGSGPCPDWAIAYEAAAAAAPAQRSPRRGAAPATTCCCSTRAARPGMPKGVMWRQDDLFGALDAANQQAPAAGAGPRRRRRAGHQARAAQPARRPR